MNTPACDGTHCLTYNEHRTTLDRLPACLSIFSARAPAQAAAVFFCHSKPDNVHGCA
jgi:hypothetical protein